MIGIICACIGDIVKYFFAIEAVALCNSQQAYGAEGAFGVDVQAFALAAAHRNRKLSSVVSDLEGAEGSMGRSTHLAGDGECVADLRLARAEFAKELGNGTSFNPAC